MDSLTTEEQQEEWRYRYEERLGILCGLDAPTLAQRKLASDEAHAILNKLTDGEWVAL